MTLAHRGHRRREDDGLVVRRGSGWFLAFMALMLAGCSSPGVGGVSGSPANPGSSSVPATGQPAGPSRSESQSTGANILVEFNRQGGIRGISDHLIVEEDGTVTVTRTPPASGRSGKLTAGELADLRQQLELLSSTPLPRVDPAQGNDLYSYQVNFAGIEIHADQGAVPPALEPVIANLARIVAASGS